MLGIGKTVEIIHYEKIALSESTMRGRSEYEIVNEGDKAVVSFYLLNYSEDKEKKQPEKSAECANEEVIRILNECKISKWDGFHGKHPKHVKDGTMFSFNAMVNDGWKIFADGSQNFPKNYGVLKDWFRSVLK